MHMSTAMCVYTGIHGYVKFNASYLASVVITVAFRISDKKHQGSVN